MSLAQWQGAKRLVVIPRQHRWGAMYAAEYRIRNMMKWWSAVVAYGIGHPVLYLFSIGIGVGKLIDSNAGGKGIDGVSYLTFLAPALLASAALQGMMEEVTFPTMHGFNWRKVFYAMYATGITGGQVAQGMMIACIARGIFSTGLYWLMLLAFGAFSSPWALLTLPISIFAGTCFSAFMLALSSFIRNDDNWFAVFGRFVIAPMFLFSGTFYPLDSLPMATRWLGWISPLWHATELGRGFSYDHAISTTMYIVHFGYLTALGIIGMYVASWKFSRRLAE